MGSIATYMLGELNEDETVCINFHVSILSLIHM